MIHCGLQSALACALNTGCNAYIDAILSQKTKKVDYHQYQKRHAPVIYPHTANNRLMIAPISR
jgi:hypothetical protein